MTAQELLQYIDYTDLSEDLDHDTLTKLCVEANKAHVAALCIQKQYIAACKEQLDESIAIASVFNFPFGNEKQDVILKHIETALIEGVDELDIVIPLERLQAATDLNQFKTIILEFAILIRQVAPSKILKFIISTDVLNSPLLIKAATESVIYGKIDFVKTCTGKTGNGLTIGAVKNVLAVIAQQNAKVGFKASGGIKTTQFAKDIYKLASLTFNQEKLSSCQLRIGASGLLQSLLA